MIHVSFPNVLCFVYSSKMTIPCFYHHLATGQVESEVVVEAGSPVNLRRGGGGHGGVRITPAASYGLKISDFLNMKIISLKRTIF